RQPAGGDDAQRKVHLAAHALDDAVYQPDVAVGQPRLHAGHGVATNDRARPNQIDPRQLGGGMEQGIGADADAGGDRPAEVLALGGDDVESRGRAEVHHQTAAAVALVGSNGVDDAIGADLTRVVVKNRHAGARPWADDHRLDAEVAQAQT